MWFVQHSYLVCLTSWSSCNSINQPYWLEIESSSMWNLPSAKKHKCYNFFSLCLLALRVCFFSWCLLKNTLLGNHNMSTALTLFELSIDNAIKYLCYTLGTLRQTQIFSFLCRPCAHSEYPPNGKYMLWNLLLSFRVVTFYVFVSILLPLSFSPNANTR